MNIIAGAVEQVAANMISGLPPESNSSALTDYRPDTDKSPSGSNSPADDNNPPPGEGMLTFDVYEDENPEAYGHILVAILQGYPSILTYDGNGLAADERHKGAMDASGLSRLPKATKIDRDMYPFKSVLESGNTNPITGLPASVSYMSASDNRSAGGKFGAFVTKNQVKKGDKIQVVLHPKKNRQPQVSPVKSPADKKIPDLPMIPAIPSSQGAPAPGPRVKPLNWLIPSPCRLIFFFLNAVDPALLVPDHSKYNQGQGA